MSNPNQLKRQKKRDFSSPYNFIELNQEVFPAYNSSVDIPNARALGKELISGEIIYEITAQTPILYADNVTGLSASAFRGLVRNNLQILGYTSLVRDIENTTFKYRAIGKRQNRLKYLEAIGLSTISTPAGRRENQYSEVRAGIMRADEEGYYIVPTRIRNGKGFFKLDVARIRREDSAWREHYNVHLVGPLKSNIFEIIGTPQCRFLKSRMKKVSWKGGNATVEAIGEVGVYPEAGYLLYSYERGGIKRCLYLIPCGKVESKKFKFRISPKHITDYKTHLYNNMDLDDIRYYYDVPKKGEEKPVFFIQRDGDWESDKDIDFGFTMLFPISYDHSVWDGLPKSHLSGIVDYDMAMFGFSNAEISYEGRVSFAEPVKIKNSGRVKVELYAPDVKPHASNSYIRFDNDESYNSDHFVLNGIKQYWLHKHVEKITIGNRSEYKKNLKGDQSGSKYKGTIRFYNLREDELGLLLWSIRLNSESEQNIGAGRQYGYGRIKVEVVEMRKWDKPQQLASYSDFGKKFDKKEGVIQLEPQTYIDVYREKLNDFLDGKLNTTERLQEFFLMKDVRYIPERKKITYMELEQYRYVTNFPKVTDVATAKEWLIIPEAVIKEIPRMSWEEFLHHPPEELEEMHPEREVLDAYKECVELLDFFHINHKYVIRKEIFMEFLELKSYVSDVLNTYYQAEKRAEVYKPIIEHIETCKLHLEEMHQQSDVLEEQLWQEALPVLHVELLDYVFNKEDKQVRVTTKTRTAIGSAPVKVKEMQLVSEEKIVKRNTEKHYLEGGEELFREMDVSVTDENIQSEYIPLKVNILYETRLKQEKKEYSYEVTLEIPLFEGEFERLENPYSSWEGPPVEDRNMIFGREEMLEDILEKIASCSTDYCTGRNIIIFGQKRTGKSTMLHLIKTALEEQFEQRYVVGDVGNIGSINLKSSDTDVEGRANLILFYRKMIDAVKSTLRSNYKELFKQLKEEQFEFPRLKGISESEAAVECETFFIRLAERISPEKRIVLLIDEFTYFYDLIIKQQLDDNFMRFWKAFIQNTKICVILIGQDFMEDFISAYPNEFGTSHLTRITYLDTNASHALVREPFKRENGYRGFSEQAVQEIVRLTAGNAYFTMTLCSKLIGFLNEKKNARVVTPHIIEQFLTEQWLNINSSKRESMDFFESLYIDGSHEEWSDDNITLLRNIAYREEDDPDKEGWVDKAVLLSMHGIKGNDKEGYAVYIPNCEEKLNRLVKRDVLSEKNGKVRMRVPLFARWLKEH